MTDRLLQRQAALFPLFNLSFSFFLWGLGWTSAFTLTAAPTDHLHSVLSKGKATGPVSDPVGDKHRSRLLPAVDDTAAEWAHLSLRL